MGSGFEKSLRALRTMEGSVLRQLGASLKLWGLAHFLLLFLTFHWRLPDCALISTLFADIWLVILSRVNFTAFNCQTR